MNISNRVKNFLPPIFLILRALIIFLILLIVYNAIFSFTFLKRKEKTLIFMDASKSMAGEKFDNALKVLEDFLKKGLKKYEIWVFSDTIEPFAKSIRPEGKRTNISKVLDFAQKKDPAAVFLLSDGLHNAINEPTVFKEKLDFPIYPIGFGVPRISNWSIASVDYIGTAYLFDTIKIIYRIKSENLKGGVSVSLFQEGRLISKNELYFSSPNQILEDSFKVIAQKPGRVVFTLEMDKSPDESNYNDNRFLIPITIKKRELKILYLTTTPSFNITLLKKAIAEEKFFEGLFLASFDKKNLWDLSQDFKKKNEIDLTADFSVLIFDDFDYSFLNPYIKERLIQLMKKAKGILFLLGLNFSQKDFAELLPYTYLGVETDREISASLTEEGKKHTLFNEISEVISELPPFLGQVKVKPKPDAKIFLSCAESQNPLFIHWRKANQSVGVLSGFPFWRWLFTADDVIKEKSNRFLINLLKFLSIGEGRFSIQSDRPFYYEGENVRIKAEVSDEIGEPMTDLDLYCEIEKIGLKAPMIEVTPGVYTINFSAPDSGELLVNVFSFEKKIKAPPETIKILPLPSETPYPGMDTLLLKSLAEGSGGRCFLFPHLPNDLSFVKFSFWTQALKLQFQNNRYIYLFLVLIYLIEIFLRKRKGLP